MDDGETRRPSKKPRGDDAAGGGSAGPTAFALRAAKHLAAAADSGGGNIVFSPLSIYAALALVAAVARGATLDELLAARSLDELAEFARADMQSGSSGGGGGGPLVAFACGVWHDEEVALKPDYCAAAVEVYNAETRAVDFRNKEEEAREEINRWVSGATKGLIPSILPPGSVHSLTRLVLANAIYFKGMWSFPFDKSQTKTRRFRRLDGSHVSAPFMTSLYYQAVRKGDGFKVLKLPYLPYPGPCESLCSCTGPPFSWSPQSMAIPRWDDSSFTEPDGPRFSMCVFLPDAADGLPSLIDRMAAAGASSLWDDLPAAKRVEVSQLWLPRFKLSFSSQINGVLETMGVRAAFDEFKVDLTGILCGVEVVLEQVFHRAVIEVNEEGTEAVGSCAVSSRKLQCARRKVDFVADHPFAFFVVEASSRAVVFMGHMLDPTAASD